MTFANDGSFSPVFTRPDDATTESSSADTSPIAGAAFLLNVPVLSGAQYRSFCIGPIDS